MHDRLQDVVEHHVRRRQHRALRVRRVVGQVGSLQNHVSNQVETDNKEGALTHSSRPRMILASQIDDAASSDGGAAIKRHSRHEISMRYLPIVRTWTLYSSALLTRRRKCIGFG
jgi:hypothetical protein